MTELICFPSHFQDGLSFNKFILILEEEAETEEEEEEEVAAVVGGWNSGRKGGWFANGNKIKLCSS